MSNTEPEYKPTLTSDWSGSQGTIDIVPTEVWDNFGDLIFDGNFAVDNDTALLLGSSFAVLADDSAGDLLIPHIDNYLHADIIGPQHWGFLNISTKKNFPQCLYKNCHIQVIAPGINGPYPDTAEGIKARNILLFKTSIEQVILPAIGYIIDKNNLFEDKEWVKNVLTEAYPLFTKAVDLSQSKSGFFCFNGCSKRSINQILSTSGYASCRRSYYFSTGNL